MISSCPVYIVIANFTIGGAEKRLLGLWRHLVVAEGYPVKVILFRSLANWALDVDELQPIPTQTWEIVEDSSLWRKALRERILELQKKQPDATFHYLLTSPIEIQYLKNLSRTIYTFPATSLSFLNWKGLISVASAILFSGQVDVLDGRVHRLLSQIVPWRRSKIHLTPNSFVNLEHYCPREKRKNQLVFSGIFSAEKQAYRFVESLPVVHKTLVDEGFDVNYLMLGEDIGPSFIGDVCHTMRERGIPVESRFDKSLGPILGESLVIFSLQRTNNYPSKALLEGMACGCLPIVTDVGSSELVCPRALGEYIPRDFSPQDLAQACLKYLKMSTGERQQRIEAVRIFLEENFSMTTMANYYSRLYSLMEHD